MSQGHDGALMSPPNDQRPILAFELTVGSTSRVSDFTEHLPEYSVALTQATAFAFTGTFVIAGTQACPRGKLFTTAKALHINANLGNQRLGRGTVNIANDATQTDPGVIKHFMEAILLTAPGVRQVQLLARPRA